ncbi:MAG TPA: hypothetical protein DCY40_07145 [Actinobacteria bacterium]|nr:hypothetical protein [Actinomycetota bacterium]
MSRRLSLALLGVLLAGAALTACGDGAEPLGERGPGASVVSLDGEETTTTTTLGETTTTLVAESCHAPQPPPPDWGADLVAAHTKTVDVLASAGVLEAAIGAVSDFSAGWPEQAPAGAALYWFQAKLYDLMDHLEAMFGDAGATFVAPAGWIFGGDQTLEPLAAPWEAVLFEFQVVRLPALLTAGSAEEAQALLDAGALCEFVDGFSDALDRIAAEG